MNLLLLTSHAIAEYDDLRMLTDLGYNVFSIGGAYGDEPFEGKRPALPEAPRFPDFEALCDLQRQRLGEPGPSIDWAKAALHPDIIDWADTIIVHHFPERWIVPQWENIKRKRVIWRTCGQSSPDGSLERIMAPLVAQGLEVVRYSPKERNLPDYAGETALIRFGKYASDYGPWVGDDLVVGNVTQDMRQRGDACGYPTWATVTQLLPTKPAGPGSEALVNGIGSLAYTDMLEYLRHLRTYLYTGTQPASYTLGLMEAMLSGVPVVSIQPNRFGWGEHLFEGHELAVYSAPEVEGLRLVLGDMLKFDQTAEHASRATRRVAVELFGIERIGAHWKAFLG